jgi:tRNA (mo5U34)-methyltransferase
MNFPDGEIIEGYTTLQVLKQRYVDFGLPEELNGRRSLDIGAWDGWFSFEMERHGASVTAIDLVEVKNFLYAHQRLKSKVNYLVSDVYDLPELKLAPFDYVLFLGVLYHLRHPLLALEIVCALTTEMAVIDAYVIDGEEQEYIANPIPFMEFYETDELGGNIDNWFGPTTDCLKALCRSAGFARVEYVNTWHRHARVRCYRKWEPVPSVPTCEPPVLKDALNTRSYGINFRSTKEEYITFWFVSSLHHLSRHDLRLEVGGYGTQALSLHKDAGQWSTNCRLPPGLKPGRCPVRLRTSASAFSNELYIFIDSPIAPDLLEIRSACDGVTWRESVCVTATGRFMTFYVAGIAENSDRNNVEIIVDDAVFRPIFIGVKDKNGSQQLNVQFAKELTLGPHDLVLRQAGKSSNTVVVNIIS